MYPLKQSFLFTPRTVFSVLGCFVCFGWLVGFVDGIVTREKQKVEALNSEKIQLSQEMENDLERRFNQGSGEDLIAVHHRLSRGSSHASSASDREHPFDLQYQLTPEISRVDSPRRLDMPYSPRSPLAAVGWKSVTNVDDSKMK